jgi:POT family proton-dependent oligopeptide transporter
MPAHPSFPSGAAPARHPPGLALLFVTEMWERFSYYGMRAILVLFLIAASEAGGFGWSVQQASRLYGWYTGLVYLTPVIGGYLADWWLGTHRALVVGGGIIAAGHFCLALETLASFYLGLTLIIAGTGLFKSNVSTMVGQLYGPEDPRRDSAFTLFYMGINLGGLAGSLVCGYLVESPRFGWRYGFAAAGIGMVLGLTAYLAGRCGFGGERSFWPGRPTSGAGPVPHVALRGLLLDGLRAGGLQHDRVRRAFHRPQHPRMARPRWYPSPRFRPPGSRPSTRLSFWCWRLWPPSCGGAWTGAAGDRPLP